MRARPGGWAVAWAFAASRSSVRPPEPPREPLAGEVDEEGDAKERRPDREDRLVFDRAGRRVAEADLNDVRGHRLDRHARIEREAWLLAGCDRDDHRLADGARDREHDGRGDAGQRGRQHDAEDRLDAP